MRIPVWFFLCAATVSMSCCSGDAVCSSEITAAFEIRVFDSITGDPVSDLLVVSTHGTRTDSLSATNNYVSGPVGVTGTFSVVIEKIGYATWSRDILVESGGCAGPDTVQLDAMLVPTAVLEVPSDPAASPKVGVYGF